MITVLIVLNVLSPLPFWISFWNWKPGPSFLVCIFIHRDLLKATDINMFYQSFIIILYQTAFPYSRGFVLFFISLPSYHSFFYFSSFIVHGHFIFRHRLPIARYWRTRVNQATDNWSVHISNCSLFRCFFQAYAPIHAKAGRGEEEGDHARHAPTQ